MHAPHRTTRIILSIPDGRVVGQAVSRRFPPRPSKFDPGSSRMRSAVGTAALGQVFFGFPLIAPQSLSIVQGWYNEPINDRS
jgi:hypothetical protein